MLRSLTTPKIAARFPSNNFMNPPSQFSILDFGFSIIGAQSRTFLRMHLRPLSPNPKSAIQNPKLFRLRPLLKSALPEIFRMAGLLGNPARQDKEKIAEAIDVLDDARIDVLRTRQPQDLALGAAADRTALMQIGTDPSAAW